MNYLQLLRKYPNYISYGALHFFFSSPGQTFFISLFVIYFTKELEISQLDFDWLYSGGTLLSALILPMIGSWVDVIRLRYFSIALGICFALICVGVALSNSIYVLFFLIFGLRLCGQALMTLTANTAIGRFFHKTRGKALSLTNFGVSIGETILPPLIADLILLIGWRLSWGIVAVSLVLVFIPLVIVLIPLQS
ncbi:MAG: MFS transporter, partial [Bacteroidota bacterium]